MAKDKKDNKPSAEPTDNFLEGLSTKISNMLANSFTMAAATADLKELKKNLTTTLTDGLKDIEVDKILEEKILKDTKVKKVGEDIKKKVEDVLGNINIKVSKVVIPKQTITADVKVAKISPQVVKLLADASGLKVPKIKAVEVPVKYKPSELPSPKAKSIEIPVKYKADKLEVLKSEPVTVPVEYDYGKFQLPKKQKLEFIRLLVKECPLKLA